MILTRNARKALISVNRDIAAGTLSHINALERHIAPFCDRMKNNGLLRNDIVTLTMNPALDVTVEVDRVFPGHKLRCDHVRRDAGGGGINVARVIRRLGGDPLALFPAGGAVGHVLEQLLDLEHVRHTAVPIAEETREDFTVDEASAEKQFRFVLPGPPLRPEEVDLCLDLLEIQLRSAGFLVASGSLPPRVGTDFYQRVAELADRTGARFMLDTSGKPLRAALSGHLHLLKSSLRELEETVGVTLGNEADQLAAMHKLVEQSCTQIALTLGEHGALFVSRDFALRAKAPNVNAASTVGAGDSFLGALVWAEACGLRPDEALRQAVAAGSAALLSRGTGLCIPADIERLAREVVIESVP